MPPICQRLSLRSLGLLLTNVWHRSLRSILSVRSWCWWTDVDIRLAFIVDLVNVSLLRAENDRSAAALDTGIEISILSAWMALMVHNTVAQTRQKHAFYTLKVGVKRYSMTPRSLTPPCFRGYCFSASAQVLTARRCRMQDKTRDMHIFLRSILKHWSMTLTFLLI